jgi:hypothetical protein
MYLAATGKYGKASPDTMNRANFTRFAALVLFAILVVTGSVLGSESHEGEPSSGDFHFTNIRAWYYRDFLPDSNDSDVLGLEFNSAWGWGDFAVSNISYFEVVDYPRAVPGKPAGNPTPEIGSATGITDFLSVLLFSKKDAHHGRHHFSYGLGAQLPTASDGTIGSGKWAVGPAVDYEYTNGPFFAAFVALQL